MNAIQITERKIKATEAVRCKFCGKMFDLSTEGNTHADGTYSHERCLDVAQFESENSGDWRD